MIIRNMEKRDIPQVQEVAKVSWHHTYEGIIPLDIQKKFLQSAYSDERMQRRKQYSLVLVSEIEGKIVGFSNFSFVNDEGIAGLVAIYIYPDDQGKGIGTALLEEGIKRLQGVKKVLVHVEKDNQVGKYFYTAKGFVEESEFTEDFEGHTLETIRMVLDI
ncbi:GNAT family N-acetyltransferase [Bacillus sp. CLL-7-23]|uniref:GNAT family N-acetyltransferase n=1 Tax=Bacillus changyiensis TaxID=3004103 RepID=A0ABT4X7X6_9BACI|nr:GNAT family N-acetyltransferase [Bacillus changyiensis]MDA7027442.1 GNAT family N-acetyltransferase [Bacillus changyiensis]